MIEFKSSTKPIFWVLLLSRQAVRQDSMTLTYRVMCFLNLPLDPLITLSSGHFTRGKIANECDVTFEWYRNTFMLW